MKSDPIEILIFLFDLYPLLRVIKQVELDLIMFNFIEIQVFFVCTLRVVLLKESDVFSIVELAIPFNEGFARILETFC